MITRVLILILLSASFSFAADGGDKKPTMPVSVANQLTSVKGRLDGPLNGLRMQLLHIPDGVHVDPPPRLDNFERDARVGVTVRADAFTKEVEDILDAAEKSAWEEKEFPGYPRWCVRFIGPWNETLAEWLIDREGLAVCVDGTWFRVSKEFVDRVTVGLVEQAARTAGK